MESITSNNDNISCPAPLLWTQSGIDQRKSRLYVCIIACIIHSAFWLQLIFYSSLRKKSMQWIYAYLITDFLLLFRFIFVYIVRTLSTECQPNQIWAIFIYYMEATVDNYLNILEAYILLALNICRYIQIAYNRNVYLVDTNRLIVVHLGMYLIALLFFLIQFPFGWARLIQFSNRSCDVDYTNIYIQILNIIVGFALPIILNIFVIYLSIRHVHLTATLRRTQHHISAREKYHRSLVIQFLLFYIIWFALWSPNVIVYQILNGDNIVTHTVRLLNFTEIALDPIIIAALDVRFWHVWKRIWMGMKNTIIFHRLNHRQIQPLATNIDIQPARIPPLLQTNH